MAPEGNQYLLAISINTVPVTKTDNTSSAAQGSFPSLSPAGAQSRFLYQVSFPGMISLFPSALGLGVWSSRFSPRLPPYRNVGTHLTDLCHLGSPAWSDLWPHPGLPVHEGMAGWLCNVNKRMDDGTTFRCPQTDSSLDVCELWVGGVPFTQSSAGAVKL